MSDWIKYNDRAAPWDTHIWVGSVKGGVDACIFFHKHFEKWNPIWTHWKYADMPEPPKEERKYHRCAIDEKEEYICLEYRAQEHFLYLDMKGHILKVSFCPVCGYSPKDEKPLEKKLDGFNFTKADM